MRLEKNNQKSESGLQIHGEQTTPPKCNNI